MATQLNIKDARAIELAQQLAARKGKSVTATIRSLLEDEQQRLDEEVERRVAEILEAGRRFRASLPPEVLALTSKEWMDAIYDDDGLPET